MPWTNVPPTVAADTQDYDWITQFWKALRERHWFRTGTVAPHVSAPPLPEPEGNRRKWPKHSEHHWFSTVDSFTEDYLFDALGYGFWDNAGPDPFSSTENPDNWAKGPWDVVIELDEPGSGGGSSDSDVNVDRNVRLQIVELEESGSVPTGGLVLRKTRDLLTSKVIAAYDDLVGKNFFIIPRYGLWWHERWPVPPNPTPEQYRAITDYAEDRRPTSTTLYVLRATPPGVAPHPAYGDPKYDNDGVDLTKRIPGATFDATDPDDPESATHELMVRGDDGLVHRVPILAAAGDTVTYWDDGTLGSGGGSGGSGGSGGGSIVEWDAEDDAYVVSATNWRPDYGNMAEGEPAAEFAIIARGGVYELGRERHEPLAYYRGTGISDNDPAIAWARVFCHHPDDRIRKSKTPGGGVVYKEGFDPDECELLDETSHPGFDVDLWSHPENVCSAADKPFARDFWKTYRALQLDIRGLAPSFVEDKDYTSSPAIPDFTLATFYKAADLPAHESTVTSIGSSLTISAVAESSFGFTGVGDDSIEYPLLVNYSIAYYPPGSDEVLYAGTALLTSATNLELDLSGQSTEQKAGVTGAVITLAPGETQFVPLEFRHPYPRWVWTPDRHPDSDTVLTTATLVDFVEEGLTGRGTWNERLPDETYTELSALGDDTRKSIEVGQLARFVGDNWHEVIDAPSGIQAGVSDTPDTELGFWDAFFVGRLAEKAQRQKVESLYTLTAAKVGPKRLEGTATGRWFTYWHREGLTHTETGTADGGDDVGFDDSSKTAGEESGAFWELERWPAGRTAYELFTVQFSDDGGVTYPERRLIRSSLLESGSGGGTGLHVELDPDDPLPWAADGKQYRIQEPYEANRWRERPVELTWPDGHSEWNFVEANDDVALFLYTEPTRPLEVGVTARVVNIIPGGVGRWMAELPGGSGGSGGDAGGDDYLYHRGLDLYWVPVTSGADAARLGVDVPQDFEPQAPSNLPGIVRRFGLMAKGQYWGKTNYAELRKMIDALSAYKTEYGWIKNPDDPLAANTFSVSSFLDYGATASDYTITTSTQWWDALVNGTGDIWNGSGTADRKWYGLQEIFDSKGLYGAGVGGMTALNPGGYADGVDMWGIGSPPYIVCSSGENHEASDSLPSLSVSFSSSSKTAFGQLSVPPETWLDHEVDWYAYSQIDDIDTPPGATGDMTDSTNPYIETAFQPHGTGLLYHKYDKWTETAAGETVTDSALGADLIFAPPTPPSLGLTSPNGPNSTFLGGFYVSRQAAVVRCTGFEFHA